MCSCLHTASEEKEKEPSETDANQRHNDAQKQHKTHPNPGRFPTLIQQQPTNQKDKKGSG